MTPQEALDFIETRGNRFEVFNGAGRVCAAGPVSLEVARVVRENGGRMTAHLMAGDFARTSPNIGAACDWCSARAEAVAEAEAILRWAREGR